MILNLLLKNRESPEIGKEIMTVLPGLPQPLPKPPGPAQQICPVCQELTCECEDVPMTEDELKAAIRQAEGVKKDVEDRRSAARSEARRKVDEQFAGELHDAALALSDAQRALRDYIDENASHPWEGKKVVRKRKVLASRFSRSRTEIIEHGFVEVRRKGTEMPRNSTYFLPTLGRAFVRKAKKDGSPGKAIYDGHARGVETEGWRLAE